jgi:2-keto-4-pentenoate hydratase/2-oxohepta-3-ene-1,7-dioic acid hydratase in catechol pathway
MKITRYQDAQGMIHWAADGFRMEGDLFGSCTVTDEPAEVAQCLAPVSPAVILCVGLNFRKHAEEMKSPIPEHPVVFMKNPAAVQHPEAPILIPTHLASSKVDYECELAVVIRRTCRNVRREEALDYVLGYTCGNDVSARDWQKEWGGGQWCRAKSFDTFCPLGPCLVTPDELTHPHTLTIRTLVNGDVRQESNTADMIFDVPSLIEFLSGSTTLLPGTVILTGTPGGVGMGMKPPRWLQVGDAVSIEIEGIGTLTNPVEAEPL